MSSPAPSATRIMSRSTLPTSISHLEIDSSSAVMGSMATSRAAERGPRASAEESGRGGAIAAARRDGAVTISGAVIDAATSEGVGGVEVVFRSDAGEETTTAGPDGKYRIDVPRGTYRTFVRDE